MKKIIKFVCAGLLLGTLAACGDNPDTPDNPDNPDTPATTGVTLTVESIADKIPEGKTYAEAGYTFTVGNYSFSATTGVGKASVDKDGKGYGAVNAIQFYKVSDNKRDRGAIKNTTPITGCTTVTVTWYFSRSSEAPQYFPVLQAGTSADALSAVSANETTDLTGEATGKYDGSYEICKFVNHYTIPSGAQYFSFEGAAGSASYVGSIVVA